MFNHDDLAIVPLFFQLPHFKCEIGKQWNIAFSHSGRRATFDFEELYFVEIYRVQSGAVVENVFVSGNDLNGEGNSINDYPTYINLLAPAAKERRNSQHFVRHSRKRLC